MIRSKLQEPTFNAKHYIDGTNSLLFLSIHEAKCVWKYCRTINYTYQLQIALYI